MQYRIFRFKNEFSLSDGYIRSLVNNDTTKVYPLNMHNKIIAEGVNYYYNEMHKKNLINGSRWVFWISDKMDQLMELEDDADRTEYEKIWGTNFYARIIPKEEDKQKLIDAINKNQFNTINEMAETLYGISDEYTKRGIIHIGKRSAGWKFLWNANIRERIVGLIDDKKGWVKNNIKYDYDYLYSLTKESISNFLHRDDVIIVSEYYRDDSDDNTIGEDVMSADEFMDMALNWNKEDGFDSNSYRDYQISKGERIDNWYDSERCRMWENLGFEINNGVDFYSDGLRFSTSLCFS